MTRVEIEEENNRYCWKFGFNVQELKSIEEETKMLMNIEGDASNISHETMDVRSLEAGDMNRG